MNPRLHAVLDLMMPDARESAGLHDYDGVVQDLSPDGVTAGLARLGGPPLGHAHDDAHLGAFEDALRVGLGEVEAHRWNPLVHVGNLDLAGYDRPYAPADVRAAARRGHLAGWDDAVDAALAALDRVPAPVAAALLPAVRGLAESLDPADEEVAGALAAHSRLIAHVERAAVDGPPEVALGGRALARLLEAGETLPVDVSRLAARAETERARLLSMLTDACARLRPGVAVRDVVVTLSADHPDAAGVLDEARALTAETIAFTTGHDLVTGGEGECRVEPAPESRRWAMALLAPAAPFEVDGPSFFQVTPPDPAWPAAEQEEWLSVFNRSQLPAIAVHEVAPGHFTHFRRLRQAPGDVRKALHSATFVEGWAHYAEELCLDEGFRADDPRFAVGVIVEALIRVTRLAVSIGVHTGALTLEDATERFRADGFLQGPAARSEAVRSTFDPTYGRYTWGKLEITALRDEARARWGRRYSHCRFHDALLDLGAPPLGLIDAAL